MKANAGFRDQLYRLLPGLYRERDNALRDSAGKVVEPGDLATLLAAPGELLDRFHRTLIQMLYDRFPDQAGTDENGTERSCQPWLLPYFARLLDVALVSPDLGGQRAEVAKAVAWRQSKGTLPCVEDLAQDVGRFEVEIQEGWKRVATTPRAGDPLLPAKALGEPTEMDMDALPPSRRALHPGIKAATIDFRQRSRAVRCDAANPAAHTSTMGGVTAAWRLMNPHGAPCLPGSYQDASLRTPDLRNPDWRRGHFHPRRALLFMPLPEGYFSPRARSLPWSAIREETDFESELIEIRSGTAELNGREAPFRLYRGKTAEPLRISSAIDFDDEGVYRFENLWLDRTVDVKRGRVEMLGCAARNVIAQMTETGTLDLDAKSCLFRSLRVARGLARLEYCTVLESITAEALEASDCIFLQAVRKDITGPPEGPARGCIRYSRLKSPPLSADLSVHARSVTYVKPWFVSENFGEPGCGVLHPGADPAVRSGAEDGGEMGAYHDRLYALRQDAIVEKLSGYLPVGQRAVLVPDTTLWCPPPGAA